LDERPEGGTGRQLIGSLAAAALIVAAAIWAVTARLGPTSIAEREAAEERAEESEEEAEERSEEAADESGGNRRRKGRDR
jgi:ribosomal protein L12E/L44/L45/RPP1/RPP2